MVDASRFGMAEPTLTTTLYDAAGKVIGAIHTSQVEETATPNNPARKPVTQFHGYAMASNDPAVFEIPPQAVRDLESTATRLHSDAEPKPSPTPAATPSAAPQAPPAADLPPGAP